MKIIAQLYFAIGSILGLVMELSYMWAALYVIFSAGLLAGFLPAVLVIATGTISAIIRSFIWFPALIYWIASDQGYSFGKWLAPGFYASAGSMMH